MDSRHLKSELVAGYRTSINLYRYEYCIEKTDRYTALLYRRAGTIGLASDYTLGIYADGYIFLPFLRPFMFVCLFLRLFVRYFLSCS